MKIGLGIATYNRLDYLKQCLDSVKDNPYLSHLVISDDGSTDDTLEWLQASDYKILGDGKNHGVAHSKNLIIKELLDKECDYIFIMENDILVKDPKVFMNYISYGMRKGLQHLNFGLHGNLNVGKGFLNREGIFCYENSIGAFSMYSNECLQKVGLMDENFYNAIENIEHTYRCGLNGFTTPFYEFADTPRSGEFLQEIEGSIENSSIWKSSQSNIDFENAVEYFKKKHGENVFGEKVI